MENEEPLYLVTARFDARNSISSSPRIVRELLARIDRDAAIIAELKAK
jgi:hypothetical protein